MTNKAYKEHINQLREKEHKRLPLTKEERAELDAFYQKILDEEAKYLEPANARLRAERERMERELQELQELARRKQESLDSLEALVQDFKNIRVEEKRLLHLSEKSEKGEKKEKVVA
jgi:hypothetical protein